MWRSLQNCAWLTGSAESAPHASGFAMDSCVNHALRKSLAGKPDESYLESPHGWSPRLTVDRHPDHIRFY